MLPKVILLIIVLAGGEQKEVHLVPFDTLEECKQVELQPVDHAGDGAIAKCYYNAEVFDRKGSSF